MVNSLKRQIARVSGRQHLPFPRQVIASGLPMSPKLRVYPWIAIPIVLIGIAVAYPSTQDQLLFIVLFQLVITLHLSGFVFSGLNSRIRPVHIQLFQGPSLFRFEASWGSFTLKLIPMGGSVKFENEEANEGSMFENSPYIVKFLTTAAGCIFLLAAASFGMSSSELWDQFTSGFRQIIEGAVQPRTVGAHYVERFYTITLQDGWVAGFCILAVKIAAFNLIPLGVTNGGMLMTLTMDALFPKNKVSKPFTLIGFLILMLVTMAWWLAAIVFLYAQFRPDYL